MLILFSALVLVLWQKYSSASDRAGVEQPESFLELRSDPGLGPRMPANFCVSPELRVSLPLLVSEPESERDLVESPAVAAISISVSAPGSGVTAVSSSTSMSCNSSSRGLWKYEECSAVPRDVSSYLNIRDRNLTA